MTAADTIYHGGTVLTMDASGTVTNAIAIRDGRVLALGAAAADAAGPDTRMVDLGGRTVIPGFYDAHSHFPENGMAALFKVDLNSPPIGKVERMDDLIAALRRRAEQTPPGEWVVGYGYDDSLLAEGRHPTRSDLDEATTEHPVWAYHISHHLGAANGRAIELAGLDAATPQPPGGAIRIDPTTGQPNGVLEEPSAMDIVTGHIPPLSDAQRREGILAASREYLSRGVTTAQNAWADTGMIEAVAAAARDGELPLDALLLPSWDLALKIHRGEWTLPKMPADRVRIGPAKVFADGSIQGYTGYLSKPYHTPFNGDASWRGYPIYPPQKLTQIITDLHAANMQVACHGNGDAAIDDILDAFAAAREAAPREDCRDVIVHSQMARDDQIDRMKELGITPSFFTLHTWYWGDRHRDIFMGPERAMRMSPARSALDRDVPFTIHCDTPVVPMTPLLLVWAAVNRHSTSGAVIGEDQRISAEQALRATTIDAAWQYFEEDEKGSLEPGKRADMVILSDNPLGQPDRIRDIEVLETIVRGTTVFQL